LPRADGDALQFLVKTHWLSEEDASDRAAVGAAVSQLIADAARGSRPYFADMADLGCDVLLGSALTAQVFDAVGCGKRDLAWR